MGRTDNKPKGTAGGPMRVLHFDGVNGLRLQTIIKGIQVRDRSRYFSGMNPRSSLTEDVLDRFYSELKYMSFKLTSYMSIRSLL